MSRLVIAYRGEEPWDSWVGVRLTGDFAGTGGFSGEPSAFERFAESLSAYPIGSDPPPRFAAEDVMIEVAPADSVGHLRLSVELGHPGDWGSFVRATFQTDYAWIGSLCEALRGFIRAPAEGVEIEIG